MKTTLLSVALLSLFANGQVSAKNLYTDADLPKDGGGRIGSSPTRVMIN